MTIELNLIRSIAWSFHRSTKVEWDELFGEACLAYIEALQSFDPEKSNGSQETSWAFICMRDKLISFCSKDNRHKKPIRLDWLYDYKSAEHPNYEFFELSFVSFPRSIYFKTFSKDTRTIINIVRRNPHRYALPPKKALGKMSRHLRGWGWSYPRVWKAMRFLRIELNENN